MPEKKAINQLQKQGFHKHKSSVENSIPFQGDKASDVKERFYEMIEQREIPNTSIKRVPIDDQEYLIVTHMINDSVSVQIAALIEKYGKDLRYSLLFAQFDQKSSSKQVYVGLALTFVGAFLIMFGIGIVLLIIGAIMMIGASNKFASEFESGRDNFYTTIMDIFSSACVESGISIVDL